jgi:hypothetical protein
MTWLTTLMVITPYTICYSPPPYEGTACYLCLRILVAMLAKNYGNVLFFHESYSFVELLHNAGSCRSEVFLQAFNCFIRTPQNYLKGK